MSHCRNLVCATSCPDSSHRSTRPEAYPSAAWQACESCSNHSLLVRANGEVQREGRAFVEELVIDDLSPHQRRPGGLVPGSGRPHVIADPIQMIGPKEPNRLLQGTAQLRLCFMLDAPGAPCLTTSVHQNLPGVTRWGRYGGRGHGNCRLPTAIC